MDTCATMEEEKLPSCSVFLGDGGCKERNQEKSAIGKVLSLFHKARLSAPMAAARYQNYKKRSWMGKKFFNSHQRIFFY